MVTPTITGKKELRIRIPATFNMIWDTSITTVTIGGGAAGKMNTTLKACEDVNKTLVADVNATDTGTVEVLDPVPTNTASFVGDIDGVCSGPVKFVDGTYASGLTYTLTSLSSSTDNVDFSNNGGTTYSYTPVPDADGFDSNVTDLRINPKGVFNGSSGGIDSSFDVKFRVRVE